MPIPKIDDKGREMPSANDGGEGASLPALSEGNKSQHLQSQVITTPLPRSCVAVAQGGFLSNRLEGLLSAGQPRPAPPTLAAAGRAHQGPPDVSPTEGDQLLLHRKPLPSNSDSRFSDDDHAAMPNMSPGMANRTAAFVGPRPPFAASDHHRPTTVGMKIPHDGAFFETLRNVAQFQVMQAYERRGYEVFDDSREGWGRGGGDSIVTSLHGGGRSAADHGLVENEPIVVKLAPPLSSRNSDDLLNSVEDRRFRDLLTEKLEETLEENPNNDPMEFFDRVGKRLSDAHGSGLLNQLSGNFAEDELADIVESAQKMLSRYAGEFSANNTPAVGYLEGVRGGVGGAGRGGGNCFEQRLLAGLSRAGPQPASSSRASVPDSTPNSQFVMVERGPGDRIRYSHEVPFEGLVGIEEGLHLRLSEEQEDGRGAVEGRGALSCGVLEVGDDHGRASTRGREEGESKENHLRDDENLLPFSVLESWAASTSPINSLPFSVLESWAANDHESGDPIMSPSIAIKGRGPGGSADDDFGDSPAPRYLGVGGAPWRTTSRSSAEPAGEVSGEVHVIQNMSSGSEEREVRARFSYPGNVTVKKLVPFAPLLSLSSGVCM